MPASKFIQFFTTAAKEAKALLTTGGKTSRAEAGLGFDSLGLGIVGAALIFTGAGAPVGIALIGASAASGGASSGLQIYQGVKEMKRNKAQGESDIVWGAIGIGLSVVDLGAVGAELREAASVAKTLGVIGAVGGAAMTGAGLYTSIQSHNDLGIIQSAVGIGMMGAGAGGRDADVDSSSPVGERDADVDSSSLVDPIVIREPAKMRRETETLTKSEQDKVLRLSNFDTRNRTYRIRYDAATARDYLDENNIPERESMRITETFFRDSGYLIRAKYAEDTRDSMKKSAPDDYGPFMGIWQDWYYNGEDFSIGTR